jgi:hypothetical protein
VGRLCGARVPFRVVTIVVDPVDQPLSRSGRSGTPGSNFCRALVRVRVSGGTCIFRAAEWGRVPKHNIAGWRGESTYFNCSGTEGGGEWKQEKAREWQGPKMTMNEKGCEYGCKWKSVVK